VILLFLFELITDLSLGSANRSFYMLARMFFAGYFLKPFDVYGRERIFLHCCLLSGRTQPPQLVELAIVL
jgi:hypothetical protein